MQPHNARLEALRSEAIHARSITPADTGAGASVGPVKATAAAKIITAFFMSLPLPKPPRLTRGLIYGLPMQAVCLIYKDISISTSPARKRWRWIADTLPYRASVGRCKASTRDRPPPRRERSAPTRAVAWGVRCLALHVKCNGWWLRCFWRLIDILEKRISCLSEVFEALLHA